MADIDETRGVVDVETEPAVAQALFGDGIDRARRYAADLAKYGEQLGLLGPLEYPRLWTRHIVNSALLAPLVHGRVADIGSGAGLPGIPLAIACPDVEFTLIEPMERRTDWLQRCANELRLENVRVIRARAEELHDVEVFDVVTARAVAAFSKLVPLVVPLLAREGELALLKGKSAEAEIEAAAKSVRKHHLVDVRVVELGERLETESTRAICARAGL